MSSGTIEDIDQQEHTSTPANPFLDTPRTSKFDSSSLSRSSSSSSSRKSSFSYDTTQSPQDIFRRESATAGPSRNNSLSQSTPRRWKAPDLATAYEVPTPGEHNVASYFDTIDSSIRRESTASPSLPTKQSFYLQPSTDSESKTSNICPFETSSSNRESPRSKLDINEPAKSTSHSLLSSTSLNSRSSLHNPLEPAHLSTWQDSSVCPFDNSRLSTDFRSNRQTSKSISFQSIPETETWKNFNNPSNEIFSVDTSSPPPKKRFSLRNFSFSQDATYRASLPPRRLNSEVNTVPSLTRPPLAVIVRRNTMAYVQRFSVSSEQLLARRPTLASVFRVEKPDPEKEIPIFSTTELSPETIKNFMDEVKVRHDRTARHPTWEKMFPWVWRLVIVVVFYLFLVGKPMWNGMIYSLWKFIKYHELFPFACMVFIGYATITAWLPLVMVTFEGNPTEESLSTRESDASETALIIPAYKAAGALPATIEHALKIFKPRQIFIIANGNSPTPLDETADVCRTYGVNHTWVPVGSKITAEFVGCALAKEYKYIIMIDDDVHLPANFPVVSSRLNEKTACIGYTIKSTGANGCRGTLWQQAQDLEYKSAGLTRTWAGKFGSATFPHGAITLWDRKILMSLFWNHPGYQISEDWYFGHVARAAGYRIQFCSQVFVETETPTNLFWPQKDSARGGYGEMTIWKQRMMRWDFFHLYRIKDNVHYLLCSWRLGWLELITKWCVFNEIYETLTYLIRPFFFAFSFVINPKLSGITLLAVFGMYLAAAVFFNAFHLRKKNEMFRWQMLPTYFWMKFLLGFVDTASVFYQFYAYSNYFAKTHRRVVDNFDALEAAKKCMDGLKEEMQQIMDDLEIREKEAALANGITLLNEKTGVFIERTDEIV